MHYRYRGWNGSEAHLARDAAWAADEAVRRYGDVPVCLAGFDMGGRAALHAGGHEAVSSVLAIAPWLPEDDVAASPEPVKQLVGGGCWWCTGRTTSGPIPSCRSGTRRG
ncbi:hypothetical protein GCM10020295_30560 [Streptomyces cinereospinus]